MGGIQLLGLGTRGLIPSLRLAIQSDLHQCGDPVERARAFVEPRHKLFTEEHARRRQLSGAFERANVEVRLVVRFRIAAGVEPQRAQKPRSTPGEDSNFAITPRVSETTSSAKDTNTELARRYGAGSSGSDTRALTWACRSP